MTNSMITVLVDSRMESFMIRLLRESSQHLHYSFLEGNASGIQESRSFARVRASNDIRPKSISVINLKHVFQIHCKIWKLVFEAYFIELFVYFQLFIPFMME